MRGLRFPIKMITQADPDSPFPGTRVWKDLFSSATISSKATCIECRASGTRLVLASHKPGDQLLCAHCKRETFVGSPRSGYVGAYEAQVQFIPLPSLVRSVPFLTPNYLGRASTTSPQDWMGECSKVLLHRQPQGPGARLQQKLQQRRPWLRRGEGSSKSRPSRGITPCSWAALVGSTSSHAGPHFLQARPHFQRRR